MDSISTRYRSDYSPLSAITAHFAGELGGALYNAGWWDINDTSFLNNTAGSGGLAIHDQGSSLVLWHAIFDGNAFSCPPDQYSDAHHVSMLIVRFPHAHKTNSFRTNPWQIEGKQFASSPDRMRPTFLTTTFVPRESVRHNKGQIPASMNTCQIVQ